LASKYEDLKPMGSDLIAEKISHQALSKEDILCKHSEMLILVQFDLNIATHYDLYLAVIGQCTVNPQVKQLSL
jgi:hypothetical protein